MAEPNFAAPDFAKLDHWVDEHFDAQVRFLQALVQVPPTRC